MGRKAKPICKWDKEQIRDNLDKLREIIRDPKFICRKCGRASHEAEHLCKPEDM